MLEIDRSRLTESIRAAQLKVKLSRQTDENAGFEQDKRAGVAKGCGCCDMIARAEPVILRAKKNWRK